MPWSDPLAFPIKLRDGRELRTLGEAAELILRLSETIQGHPWVEYAAQLLMRAAENGDAPTIEDATWQVHRALKREGMI